MSYADLHDGVGELGRFEIPPNPLSDEDAEKLRVRLAKVAAEINAGTTVATILAEMAQAALDEL